MQYLLGEYDSTVDAKGRFLLPAGIRRQLPEDGTQFVMNRGFEGCVTMYPMYSWEPLFAKISKLNEFKPKVREFRRTFLAGVTQVDLDSAGRVLLTKNLMDYAGISKDIVIVAAGEKIEVWDKEKYNKLFEKHTPDSFSDLADDVLGDGDLDELIN